MERGLVLFAHGARTAAWREPLDALAAALRRADAGCDIELAFLELMPPDLPTAIDALAARGARRIAVLPVFWARGGHVVDDLPALLDAARARHPAVDFRTLPTLSELPGLLDYVAAQAIALAR